MDLGEEVVELVLAPVEDLGFLDLGRLGLSRDDGFGRQLSLRGGELGLEGFELGAGALVLGVRVG